MDQSNVQDLQARLHEALQRAGLAYEDVKVFGRLRTYVHVKCVAQDTANSWGSLLRKVLGGPVSIVHTSWEAAMNKGTCLKPTMRRGFLVVAHDGGAA